MTLWLLLAIGWVLGLLLLWALVFVGARPERMDSQTPRVAHGCDWPGVDEIGPRAPSGRLLKATPIRRSAS